jgi:hypothetical protein
MSDYFKLKNAYGVSFKETFNSVNVNTVTVNKCGQVGKYINTESFKENGISYRRFIFNFNFDKKIDTTTQINFLTSINNNLICSLPSPIEALYVLFANVKDFSLTLNKTNNKYEVKFPDIEKQTEYQNFVDKFSNLKRVKIVFNNKEYQVYFEYEEIPQLFIPSCLLTDMMPTTDDGKKRLVESVEGGSLSNGNIYLKYPNAVFIMKDLVKDGLCNIKLLKRLLADIAMSNPKFKDLIPTIDVEKGEILTLPKPNNDLIWNNIPLKEKVIATISSVTTPREMVKATSVTTPREMAKATSVTTPREMVKATSVTTPREMAKATSVTTPREMVKATSVWNQSGRQSVTTPGQMIKATSVTTPGQMAKATSVTTPGQMIKATSVTTPGQMAKATSVTTPGQMAKATSVTTPGQMVKATSVTTPREMVKATSVTTPREMVKATSVTTPREMAKATSVTTSGQIQASSTATK